jgi:hypothetical protein
MLDSLPVSKLNPTENNISLILRQLCRKSLLAHQFILDKPPSQSPLSRLMPGIGTVTLIALVVRVLTATWTGLTTDEANGVMIAVSGSLGDMLQHLKDDGNAPVFYGMVREYAKLFGHTDLALKPMQVLISTAEIPFAYWLFRHILSRGICLQLALMLAFSPSLVRYSTLVRPYALEGIIGLISTYACMRTLSRATNPVWATIYGISTALLVYTHYWGAFVPIGHLGLVLIGLMRGWFTRKQLIHWFAGAALSFLVFVPQLPVVLFQLKHDLSPWDLCPRPTLQFAEFLPMLLVGTGFGFNAVNELSMFICNILVLIAFVCPSDPNIEEGKLAGLYEGRLWKTATICGLAAGFCMNFLLPSMRYRYLMPFIPMIFIVYLTGMKTVLRRAPKFVRDVLPAAIWIVMSLPHLWLLHTMPETRTPDIVAEISHNYAKGDLVVISWQVIAPAITFYLPKEIDCVSFPDLERTEFNYWPEMTQRLREPDKMPKLIERMDNTLKKGGRIWLIEWARECLPLDYRDNELAQGVGFQETNMRRMDQIRSWLETHAVQQGNNHMAPGNDFSIFLSLFGPADAESKAQLPKVDNLWRALKPEEGATQDRGSGAAHN